MAEPELMILPVAQDSNPKKPGGFSHIAKLPVLLELRAELTGLARLRTMVDDDDVVYIEEGYDAAAGEKAEVFWNGLEAKFFEYSGSFLLPESRGLPQTIKSLIQLPAALSIRESFGHLSIDLFIESTVQECVT